MLGVPFASALTLALLFLAGSLIAAGAWLAAGRPRPRCLEDVAVGIALAVVVVSSPYAGWRIVEDLRYTTGLDPYERQAAGPIQSFLPGYLLDGARTLIPPDETYATVVGPSVPYPVAVKAFPALVLDALFPRRSVPAGKADWIIAWGTRPSAAAPVGRVLVAHPRQGPLPPVLVARTRR